MNLHEEGLVKASMEPSRQERILAFLAQPKKRPKFTDELAHRRNRFLKPKFFKSIPPAQQNPSKLFALLKLGSARYLLGCFGRRSRRARS